jgi:hypothetical protein
VKSRLGSGGKNFTSRTIARNVQTFRYCTGSAHLTMRTPCFCESSWPSPRRVSLRCRTLCWLSVEFTPTFARNIDPLSRRHIREYAQLFPDLSQHRVQALLQTRGKYLAGEPPFEDFLSATQLHERLQGIAGFCRD